MILTLNNMIKMDILQFHEPLLDILLCQFLERKSKEREISNTSQVVIRSETECQ